MTAYEPGTCDRDSIASALAVGTPEKVQEVLKYCQEIFNEEEKRTSIIENKSHTVIAASGIISAFAVAFPGALPILSCWPTWTRFSVLLICYVPAAFFLGRTIYYGIKSVDVRQYTYAAPEPGDIFGLKEKQLEGVLLERAVDLFLSYEKNLKLNNKKAERLSKAQQSLRIGVFLLLISSGTIAICAML